MAQLWQLWKNSWHKSDNCTIITGATVAGMTIVKL